MNNWKILKIIRQQWWCAEEEEAGNQGDFGADCLISSSTISTEPVPVEVRHTTVFTWTPGGNLLWVKLSEKSCSDSTTLWNSQSWLVRRWWLIFFHSSSDRNSFTAAYRCSSSSTGIQQRKPITVRGNGEGFSEETFFFNVWKESPMSEFCKHVPPWESLQSSGGLWLCGKIFNFKWEEKQRELFITCQGTHSSKLV